MRICLALLTPLLVAIIGLYAAKRGVDVYSAMAKGAEKGLKLMAEILPALLVLFPAIYLLRAAKLPELLSGFLAPLLWALGIPEETALIMLLRPLSGSGALSAAAEIIEHSGADSLVGRTAAVMLGSSETTFYVAAVYLAAAGVKESRWSIPAALCADLACFVSSAWICRLFWGP